MAGTTGTSCLIFSTLRGLPTLRRVPSVLAQMFSGSACRRVCKAVYLHPLSEGLVLLKGVPAGALESWAQEGVHALGMTTRL